MDFLLNELNQNLLESNNDLIYLILIEENRLKNLEILFPGMLHEINNAICFIQLEAESEKIIGISQKIMKINQVICSLKSYIKQTVCVVSEPNDCIKKCLQWCEPIFKNQLSVKSMLSDNVLPISISFNQLNQIILNFMLEAANCELADYNDRILTIATTQEQNIFLLLIEYSGMFITKNFTSANKKFVLSKKIIAASNGELKIQTLDETHARITILFRN